MIAPLTPQALKSWVDEAAGPPPGPDVAPRDAPVIIDVREGWEHQRAHIEGSLHIPMQSIPGRLGELDPAAAYVLVCHHGMRSYQVAEFMARHGFERLYNLSGGIDAWASAVEPRMARY